MADYSPTIIAASLNDKELQESINKLVANVEEGTKKMSTAMTNAVEEMKKQLQSLGNINVTTGGVSDGGSSRRKKKQEEETQAVKETTVAYDKLADAQQKAVGRNNIIETIDMQIAVLLEDLKKARVDMELFGEAAKSPFIGNKAEYGQIGVARAEDAERIMRVITELESKKESLRQIMQPQGDAIKNFVRDLQKVNPELARLNEMYRSGQSMLAQQTLTAREITDEIKKQANEIRNSQQFKEKGWYGITLDKERNQVAFVEANERLSIEEQLVAIYGQQVREKVRQTEQSTNQNHQSREQLEINREQLEIDKKITQEYEKRQKAQENKPLDFNAQLAKTLGLSPNEVIFSSSGKISQLAVELKQYETAYTRLTKSERESPFGLKLREEIQETSRILQKYRAEMSRPISFDAVDRLPIKTLDDIAYKIQMLQRYRSGIDITKQGASKEIDSVNKAIAELTKKQRELLGTNKSLLESNNALARSWNYMKNRLAFYFTVGASTAFVKNLIEVRSQYEMNERALGILVDSAARGTRIFNELSQMSLVSPYTLIELSTAAKQLTAYDIAAKDVVDTTRRLADMAAAVGAPVERLTYALGQIKAYGYLNSRDARMFANAGIPLVKQLAEYYTELEGKLVSAADVYDRMKKKAIDFNAVMAVVNKMTDEGGKFFDFQAKMADTLKVRLANLTLAWNNMLNDIGKDAGGFLNNSIKSVTILFRHWRELSRVLGTIVTAIGAYKTATWLAAVTTSTSIGKSSVAAWLSLASSVRSAKDATALFSLTIKSIPFVGWVTAIASLVSWFYLFNQSGDEVKQKLQDIQSAFDGVRKEIDDLFADAIRTDSIGTQLTKLQSMLETAETELGVVIPINLEDVNESNIKQKLKEARNFIDTYLNFSQTFSEAAAGSRFNEAMNEFGSNARTIYTSITESINSVVVALQELSDKGKASKRDIEILNELTAGQKEDESRIEYLQRLISLYEELGLIGQKTTVVSKNYLQPNIDDMNVLQNKQEQNIERLGIKNKTVFSNMLKDVQGYYTYSDYAAYQFEKQIERVAKKIDINNIPVEQRTLRFQVAINEEASLNNWNEFEKEYARQIANQKYGTQIEISSESKKSAETELQDWQKRQQEWMDNHGIKVNLSFQTDETEASYASRMLQEAKDAQSKLEVQKRKLAVGTGSQEDVDNAVKELNTAIEKARAAGADLSQLDKKKSGSKKDILGDTLTKELQLITDIQKLYKEYTKAGYDSETAKTAAAKEYQKTLEQTNNTLSKFGVQGLTGEQLATMDLRAMRDYYQSILDKVQSSPKAIEALEKAIRNLNVEITKEGQKTIIDSLNSELGKLKDEYELAVELDANPELGGVFADMMGLSKEELEKLPRDFEGVVRKLQTIVDNKLGMGAFDVRSNLNKDVFDKWVKSSNIAQDSDLVAKLKALTEYANKVRLDETKKQIEDWNKLLEKYAEYEYKRTQITQEAERERETARKKGAGSDVINAIDLRERRELAKLDFEQFQKSSTWLTATGDLATLTDSALGLLIKRLEEYKKSAKNLDPKQIKQINNALKSLRREQRQGNPFLAIANAKDAAKDALDTYQQEIDEYMVKLKELNELEEKNGELTLEQESTRTDLIGIIAKLRNEQEKAGKVSVKSLTEGISGMAGAISQASNLLADFFTQIGNSEAAENLKALSETLDKASQGAQIGSSFGGYGALIGGAIGLITGLFSGWADEWSGNADITEKVKESEKQLRKLEEAYKDVEFAAEQAYGVETLGAKESLAAQKKLQLEELQRQITLEESRKEKYKDEEKIEDLKSKIHDLQLEISRSTKEIVQDLLGISSYGDAITQLVQVMIDAFRNGEDAMTAFGEKWDEMIDNMILKLVVSTFMKKEWDEIMKTLEQKKDEFLAQSTKDYQSANNELGIISKMTDDEIAKRIAEQLGYSKITSLKKYELEEILQRGNVKSTTTGGLSPAASSTVWYSIEAWQQVTNEQIQAYRDALQMQINNAEKAGENAEEAYTRWAIDFLGQGEGRKRLEERARLLEEGLGEWFKFGQDSERQALSNLQQGIQGITEDTAGSIEAYMNGVSQQVYLQSDLLTQIRDAIVGFDLDVQLGVQSQILLELQNSYQVQMSIQNILQGVLNPSGRAFMVEMQ